MNSRTAPIEIDGFTLYPDGSGATGIVKCADYHFAANYVAGETKLRALGNSNFNKVERNIAIRRCEKAFAERVLAETSEAWRDYHAEMYAAFARRA